MRRQTVALILSGLGIVLFLANAFHLLPARYTTVGSVVFLVLVVLAWALWPKGHR